ncbi:MAG: helix-turn-helix transcriptional regulator [Oscillospiraceae bacterium]|nr:helix-turn-helix transcriptional regulator [Oscillospiraceae bacterium]MBQ5312440.1 helix-turn-helix transcriptional regulator [Oscillospiraceae bacterium]MBQ5324948.1 helix-turn-helix transcriptional regulator [Oscillospiraceae bacterium]
MLGEKLITLRKKYGYSQQELADKLSVTRQTISNWELNQGAPSLDKAVELAAIYGISLDDLAENSVQVIAKEKTEKNNVLLKQAEGRMARISIFDMERWVEMGFDFNYSDKVKITEVTDRWIKIEYSRTKENHLLKKETVVKLVDIDVINGIEILEE